MSKYLHFISAGWFFTALVMEAVTNHLSTGEAVLAIGLGTQKVGMGSVLAFAEFN